ncbi:MAG: hypothetical protein AAGB19_22845 [Cyanobacteria bacterium P01_F01_bin.3]
MRDADLAVVPPEASLTTFVNVEDFVRGNIIEMEDFSSTDSLAPGQVDDLLIGSTGSFSVGSRAFSGSSSALNLEESLEGRLFSDVVNEFAPATNLPETQTAELAVPSEGILSSPSEAQGVDSGIGSLSNDISDQFLALPSFLG